MRIVVIIRRGVEERRKGHRDAPRPSRRACTRLRGRPQPRGRPRPRAHQALCPLRSPLPQGNAEGCKSAEPSHNEVLVRTSLHLAELRARLARPEGAVPIPEIVPACVRIVAHTAHALWESVVVL